MITRRYQSRAARAAVLREARSTLERQVCECSHLESEHCFITGRGNATRGCDRTCRCRRFVPVRFRVERLA